jgi:hypothetical protein
MPQPNAPPHAINFKINSLYLFIATYFNDITPTSSQPLFKKDVNMMALTWPKYVAVK